jgi:hypothetical protein
LRSNKTRVVIPGRAEGASPESITADGDYGFRTAASRLPE